MEFKAAFKALTGRNPFPWQERAFKLAYAGNPPPIVTLPTGTGKTSIIPIWLIALAGQATQGRPITLPRRVVWVVNRRVVVDQATDEAATIIGRLEDAAGEGNQEVLQDLRARLRSVSVLGQAGAAPVVVSTLRGQLADNREWSLDPSRPAIIIGTVDMIGSRLLCSGYGDGRYRRPLHAGLLGHDSWIVLDEAHLTPPFAELLFGIRELQNRMPKFAPFHVSLLSATQRQDGASAVCDSDITITPEDHADPLIARRLTARKSLRLHELASDENEMDVIVRLALSYRGKNERVLIYLRSPKQVGRVAEMLKRQAPDCMTRILTGTLRGCERDRLAADPVFSGFRAAPNKPKPEQTHYLISTSAGEVGADLDADHLICDMAPLDSLIQRLGRVNRLGEGNAEVHLVVPARIDREGRNSQVLTYLKTLPRLEAGCYSASPADLSDPPVDAFSESPKTIPLARHWLDMWSLTSIRDEDWPGRPGVAPWLHGIAEDIPETHVGWRDDIQWLAMDKVHRSDCDRVLDAYSPRPHELLREPTPDIRDKLAQLAEFRDNRLIPVVLLRRDGSLAWRGRLGELVKSESERKVTFEYSTILLTTAVGGLSADGILSPIEDSASDVADHPGYQGGRCRYMACRAEEGWTAFRLAGDGQGSDNVTASDIHGVISEISKKTKSCRPIAAVPIGGHAENEPEADRHLLYFADRVSVSQAGSAAKGKQPLVDHVDAVARVVLDICVRLDLSKEYLSTFQRAGECHDAGKNRPCWQRAIGNANPDSPLAKSDRAGFNQLLNGGYRHEFGSLLDGSRVEEVASHPHRDLILHLIACHHGNARPHFQESAFDRETGFNACKNAALEAVQRFGRLQARYGWWVLAWMESLVKAGDALVSGGFVNGGEDE